MSGANLPARKSYQNNYECCFDFCWTIIGWDKKSYGYHGDDGNSFCCSGQGQAYGPTFTTGDVIGCCLNMIDNTCFFTKNGVNLGKSIVFSFWKSQVHCLLQIFVYSQAKNDCVLIPGAIGIFSTRVKYAPSFCSIVKLAL